MDGNLDERLHKTVLLVDADLLVRWSFEKAFSIPEISFFSASTGEEALNILNIEDIDCIITDFCLPDYDGLELLHLAIQIQPGLNLALMTSFDSKPIRLEAEALGSIIL